METLLVIVTLLAALLFAFSLRPVLVLHDLRLPSLRDAAHGERAVREAVILKQAHEDHEPACPALA